MNFYMPVRLLTGRGVVAENADRIASFGKRCLIVTGGSAAKKSGALGDVTAVLDRSGIAYTVFDGIRPNPTIASCIEGGRVGRAFGAEFVVGIGGGSPLDASKIVAVCIQNPDCTGPDLFQNRWTNAPVPVVLVGTTAGTGSEVTQISVITNDEGRKAGIHDDALYAALALGDPRYTESMPLSVTATTAVDALCHCIESYLNKTAVPISRGIAARGVIELFPLLCSIADGKLPTPAERETLYNGSILGGMAICITGTVAPHAIGYLLSERYGVPHGFACAAFLPALLRRVEAVDPALAADFCRTTGTSFDALTALVEKLLPKYDLHMTDAEIAEQAKRWTAQNANIAKTPGTPDAAGVEAFLRSVFLPA